MAKRTTERSAACATCGKTFARSDTLLRHEKSHHATEDRGPVHRVTNGTFRACCACAQARSRCSGGMPCGRCKTRNLECTYPNKRRKAVGHDEDGQANFSTMTLTSEPPSDPPKPLQQYAGQFHQFSFSPASTSSFATNGQPELGRVTSTPDIPHLDQMQLKPQHPIHTDLPLATPSMQPLSTVDTSLQGITSAPQSIHNQGQYHNTSMPIDYQNTFADQSATFGDNGLYDGSLNLNWIPLSVYPSPYGDMEQDFSFLLPSLSDTASMNNDFDPLAFDASLAAGTPGSKSGITHVSSSYRPPASISGLMQSPASTVSEGIAPTGFAFDNIDIPGAKKKRHKSSHVPTGFSQPREARTDFAFPDMSMLASARIQPRCSDEKFALVFATFQRLCLNSSRWKPFSTSAFPGISSFNACIDLYFEILHPTFPLLHAPSFEQNSDWLTCLAAAAIGSTFAAIPDCPDAREAFQEFLRRAVLATTDDQDGDFRNIHLAQARVLALIGLAQSDREQLRSRAPRAHADIARWCLESSILQLTAQDEEVRSNEDIEAAWIRWIQRESLRRVGYFIWLLDCALGYIGNARPLCNMDDARAPLPCPESLWDAPSASQWVVHRNNTPPMPSLCAALEAMYNNKQVEPGLSETSHILLIHALFSRTWQVGTHIKQPLSEWKATGDARGFLNTPSKDNFWLPLYPLYANWRNSACDCLDILHWQAAAQMARNAGAEHHGVLHLHLARVILLTPFQEIQDLLFFLINHRVSDLSKASFYVHDGSYQPRNPAKLPQIRKITWRWLREDQHKARLAMIHAGSVFWHVRRYSTSSFFEPLAIYLASIVLWTYGSYKSFALERDATGPTNNNGSTTLTNKPQTQYLDPSTRSSQIQTEPGVDSNVQPTRVERAAQSYISKSRSSGSRSHGSAQNASTKSLSSNASPAAPRSHPATSPLPLPIPPSFHPLDPRLPPPPSTTTLDSSPEDSGDDDEDDDDDEQPTFIHLDRPCDDEIVQHFVRNGHNMAGYMSNVGDICQTPGKVLIEGAKILRTKLACWGVSREYHDILTRLAEVRKDRDRDRDRDVEKKGKGKGRGDRRRNRDGTVAAAAG